MLPVSARYHNSSVVAMAGYRDRLYAMTRNEESGVEVWRSAADNDTVWQQVSLDSIHTGGLYGNPFINNLWGAMAVFKDKLYCGFSSGLKGSVLKSTGCEIWRYDGEVWEPIISDSPQYSIPVPWTALTAAVKVTVPPLPYLQTAAAPGRPTSGQAALFA